MATIVFAELRSQHVTGSATVDELLCANANGALCELIDGTLVEKPLSRFSRITFLTALIAARRFF